MKDKVYITDVGPRDGLQNQARVLSVSERLQLIQALLDAGVTRIEAGSFVSPKAVPAMAGTDAVFAGLPRMPGISYSTLAPNLKYYQQVREAGADAVEVFVAASETMNQKNIRSSTANAMTAAGALIEAALNDGIRPLACIATAWECPFEGKIDPSVALDIAARYFEMGADQVILADTIGAANPDSVEELCNAMASRFGVERVACHFHDTRAMGLANAAAALRTGIRHFDASVGGLGGCPFAPGATGNVPSEDLVMMLHQMGYETGINLEKLMAAGQLAGELTGASTGGRADTWRRLQLEKGRALA